MSEDKRDHKNEFESKEGKIERNKWRKLINIIFAGITLYLLLTYNVFDYTGNILGVLLVFVWGGLINYIVKKVFLLFIN